MRRISLLLACSLLAGSAFAQSPSKADEDRINREAFARSKDLLPAMKTACKALSDDPGRSLAGINFAVRQLRDDIIKAVHGKEDVAKGRALINAFERENGPADAIPSIDLHLLMAITAHDEGNEPEWIRQRAYHMAIFRTIHDSGSGEDRDHAWSPCFISNEYAMLRALQVREVKGQSLVNDKGRAYDVLDYVDRDGKERKSWFDITDSYASEARMFEKR